MYLIGLEPCWVQNSLLVDSSTERSTTWWLLNKLLALWRSLHDWQKLSLHWAQKWDAVFLCWPVAVQMSQGLLSVLSLTKTCLRSSPKRVTLKSLGRWEMLSSIRGVFALQVGQDRPSFDPPPLLFHLQRHPSQKVCWHCKTLGELKGSKHTMQRRNSSSNSDEEGAFSAMMMQLSSELLMLEWDGSRRQWWLLNPRDCQLQCIVCSLTHGSFKELQLSLFGQWSSVIHCWSNLCFDILVWELSKFLLPVPQGH